MDMRLWSGQDENQRGFCFGFDDTGIQILILQPSEEERYRPTKTEVPY